MSKADLLTQIAADLADNTTQDITPADLRGVLENIVDSLTTNVRVVTAAGGITVDPTDDIIVVSKTVGAATTVTMPTADDRLADGGEPIEIKDGKGDADSNNITFDFGAEAIDGLADTDFVIDNKYGRLRFLPIASGLWTQLA